jgi:hypothetical protein
MNANIRSAVIAGAIAAVIIAVIHLIFGGSFGGAIALGAGFFVGTSIVVLAVTTVIERRKRGK